MSAYDLYIESGEIHSIIEEPSDYPTAIISELRRFANQTDKLAMERAENDVLTSLDGDGLSERIRSLLSFLQHTRLHIVIDQSERLVSSAADSQYNDRNFLMTLLNCMKDSDNIKVIFVIREDLLAGLLKLLNPDSNEIFFVEGVDNKSDALFARKIRSKFDSISVKQEAHDRIMSASMKDGSVNTFVVELCGYLIESNEDSDASFIGKSYNDYRSIVERYVSALCEEYSYLNGDHRLAAEVEIVLFSIAAYNRKTGNHISLDRLTRVSHLPKRRVSRCVDYLRSRDVVGSQQNWSSALRLAHDVLADHVMAREAKDMRLDHKLAIEQIIDRRINDLVEVIEETDPLADPFRHIDDGKPVIDGPGTVLLWCAAVLYFYRIGFPEQSEAILRPINEWLEFYFPGSIYNAQTATALFIPIAFTQYLWVLFMFGLDTGFFLYIFKKKELNFVNYSIIHIMGFSGALMGIALSFAPAFFIISIALPGLVIATTYFLLAMGAKGNDATIFRYYYELCVTTFLNMTICFVTCFAMIRLMDAKLQNYQFDLSIVISVCVLFVYFNYQMRGRQGSRLGRASMLAIYDAGRNR